MDDAAPAAGLPSVRPAVSLLSFPLVSPITNVGDKVSGNPDDRSLSC